jgi:nucleotide-binding universal stress UspA family protein
MSQTRPARTGRTIVVYTGESDRYEGVRRRAVERARETGATLVLYDSDAASAFESPLPTNWSAEGAEDRIPKRLEPKDLEAAGRAGLAEQVQAARAEGVQAYGWLPSSAGADDLTSYAEEVGADLILMPAELDDPDLVDRVRGRTTDAAREKARVPVEVV